MTDHAPSVDMNQSGDDRDVVLSGDHLAVRYLKGALGVTDVSVKVRTGRVVALLGPNGAGKTTTVRALSGFLRNEGARIVRGQVRTSGRDITGSEPHVACSLGVAFVPERKKVFPNLTVSENLESLGYRPPQAEREAAYNRVFDLFPELRRRLKEQAGRLSGGQQQMLAISRGLLNNPRILIVDELTLGLHESVQEALFSAVRDIAAQGTSILLVDESASLGLDVADYCYLISGGVTVDEGPPSVFRGREALAAGYVDGAL